MAKLGILTQGGMTTDWSKLDENKSALDPSGAQAQAKGLSSPIYQSVQNYFSTGQDGTIDKWGGKLTKTGDKAVWTSPTGQRVTFAKGQDPQYLQAIASRNPEIASAWEQNFGTQALYGLNTQGAAFRPYQDQQGETQYTGYGQTVTQGPGTANVLNPAGTVQDYKYATGQASRPSNDPGLVAHNQGPPNGNPNIDMTTGQPINSDPVPMVQGPPNGNPNIDMTTGKPKPGFDKGPGGINPGSLTGMVQGPPNGNPNIDMTTGKPLSGILSSGAASNNQYSLKDVEPFEIKPATADNPAVYNNPSQYVPGYQDTVAGQMEGLLSQESPYMQQARKTGERIAQARGLLNSSLAGQYSQKAAIDAALPIAQQDSSVRTDAGMTGYKGQIDAARANQDYGNQANIINLQTANSSKLSSQEAQQQSALSAQGATQTERLQAQSDAAKLKHDQEILAIQNDHSLTFEEKRAALALKAQQYDDAQQYIRQQTDAAQRYKLALLEARENEKIAAMELTAGDTKALSSAVALSYDTLAQNIVQVETDPNLSPEAKTKIIQNMQNQHKAYVESIMTIWGSTVTWE